ncbi:hypothetical protein A2U01_0024714, partial [Trifolium medium]|nr:hypothetical protein [Trifolium medium]
MKIIEQTVGGYDCLEFALSSKKEQIICHDYNLTTFTSEEDQYTSLMEGPWLIYDHYLSVCEWSPTFNPRSDAIEKAAMWVRFFGLPIEFYDARTLTFCSGLGLDAQKLRKTINWAVEQGPNEEQPTKTDPGQ